jgi:aspartate aminotransferase-like enzyme
VLPALLDRAWQYCRDQGWDLAIISGITRELKLYRGLGFEPFGPRLGTPPAEFQPMMLTRESFVSRVSRIAHAARKSDSAGRVVSLLPGPVELRPAVREALARPAVSHRSPEFRGALRLVASRLRQLTGVAHVQVLLGSGTLANDVVAGQLSGLAGRGLVLVNGEFGERLVDHALRARLLFDTVTAPWGAPLDHGAIAGAIAASVPAWVWMVHCETSTGVLNDLPAMSAICDSSGVRLAVDAISSVGTLPVALDRVWMASTVSGKGLCGYPGLAIVAHNHPIAPAPGRLPRYLDLGLYARDEVPFTHSSSLVVALAAAIERDWPAHWTALARRSCRLRTTLRNAGFTPIADDTHAAPTVVTLAVPEGLDPLEVAERMHRAGFLIGAASDYLRTRGWIQICLMEEIADAVVDDAVAALRACTRMAVPA